MPCNAGTSGGPSSGVPAQFLLEAIIQEMKHRCDGETERLEVAEGSRTGIDQTFGKSVVWSPGFLRNILSGLIAQTVSTVSQMKNGN